MLPGHVLISVMFLQSQITFPFTPGVSNVSSSVGSASVGRLSHSWIALHV